MAKKKRDKTYAFDKMNYVDLRPNGNKFTEKELGMIHSASMEILSQVGIKFESEEARQILVDAGASAEGEIVKFPVAMVEEAIRTAPSVVTFAGRDPSKDYVCRPGKVGFCNFGEGVFIVDPYTKEYRPTCKKDIENVSLVADYFDVFPVAYRSVASQDAPAATMALHNFEGMINNTSKHIFCGTDGQYNAEKMIEMAAYVVGGREELRRRPILSFNICPTSPLQINPTASGAIIAGARAGVPTNVISMALTGATAPIKLAGTMVTHNAEVLAALTLNQATCKGSPFVYSSSTTIMDMQNLTTPVGAPELGLISNAVGQLAQYYKLPCLTAGG